MIGIKHEERRKYIEVEGSAYSLPHDDVEHSRRVTDLLFICCSLTKLKLSLQHNLLLRTYDGKILHAPVQLKDEDWVLESGTGTGIWLQDLLREASTNTQCIGIDLDPRLFPDPSTLPPNLKFEKHSITDLPAEWTEKFIVVHQRLLIAGLRRQEWEQAIREMYRVLKPGGWVQLFEVETGNAGPELIKFIQLMCALGDAQGTLWRDVATRVPELLQQNGFINLRSDTRKTPLGSWAGKDGIDGRENLKEMFRGLKTPLLKIGGCGIVSTEAEYDESVERVGIEMDTTPGSGTTWSMFMAQKPGGSR